MIDGANINLRREIEQDFQKSTEYIQTSIDQLESDNKSLRTTVNNQEIKLSALQKQHHSMSERMLAMETRSMRDNLIFTGIPESDGETVTDIKTTLGNLFIDDLDLDGDDIVISHCHRLPKRHNQHTRDIIARFTCYSDRLNILHSAKKLKGHEPAIYINEQFPPEIEKRRSILRPIMKQAHIYKRKASLSQDKLVIDGRVFTVDTISSVPFDTASMDTITTDDYVYFNGRLSPYSNFYRSHFVVDDTSYCCVEQYFQRAKSLHYKDQETAAEIMLSTDPGHMKKLGGRISIDYTWLAAHHDHMKTAVHAKFSQNGKLLQLLRKTEERSFVEANAYDTIWGVGIGLRSPDLLDDKKWTGKNKLGVLLDSLRDELK